MRSKLSWSLAVVAALVVGFALGRSSRDAAETWRSIAFTNAVDQAGMAAMSLELLEGDRLDTLERIQQLQLEGGLHRAHSLIEQADRLEFPLPNTVELADRARRWAQAHGHAAGLSGIAGEVHRHLAELNDEAAVAAASSRLDG